jgi:hypothetical protein
MATGEEADGGGRPSPWRALLRYRSRLAWAFPCPPQRSAEEGPPWRSEGTVLRADEAFSSSTRRWPIFTG